MLSYIRKMLGQARFHYGRMQERLAFVSLSLMFPGLLAADDENWGGVKHDWDKPIKPLVDWYVGNMRGFGITVGPVMLVTAIVGIIFTMRNPEKSSRWMKGAITVVAVVAALTMLPFLWSVIRGMPSTA